MSETLAELKKKSTRLKNYEKKYFSSPHTPHKTKTLKKHYMLIQMKQSEATKPIKNRPKSLSPKKEKTIKIKKILKTKSY